jgi:hypothetical protein
MDITDGRPKLYAISGHASRYKCDEGLMGYIAKYGVNHVFSIPIDACQITGYCGVYSFSFMAEKPSDSQIKYLQECTIDVVFEHNIIEECRA